MTWIIAVMVTLATLYLALCYVFGRDFAFLLRLALRRPRIERAAANKKIPVATKVKSQTIGA